MAVPHSRAFPRNALVSVLATALDFGVLVGLVELLDVDYVVATFLGTVIGAISNFTINRWWSYRARDEDPARQLVRFLPVQLGSSGLQTLGVWLVASQLGVLYWAAKLGVAVAVYVIWSYPMNRWFVFTRGGDSHAIHVGCKP